MTKAEREQLEKFHDGDKVVIVRSNYHPDTVGKTGTIRKVIKSRLALLVWIDQGYYSHCEEVIKAQKPDYQMTKSFEYYPSIYSVERVED